MKKRVLSRRDFLRVGGMAAGAAALAACAPAAAPTEAIKAAEATAVPTEAPKAAEPTATTAPKPAEPTPTTAPAAAEEVTLDVIASQPEYIDAEKQIWDVFTAENPNIKVNMYAVNEDTVGAFRAKIAGGYMPAITQPWALADQGVTATNYNTFVDVGKLDFPWFDRWTYDVKNAFSNVYGVPGPRSLEVFAGFLFTWQYRTDLMAETGLDPRKDVKSWDDLKAFLEKGAAWVKAHPDKADHFWDLGWHGWVWGYNYLPMLPLAFADGQVEQQAACWTGKAKFNAPDSPYRHTFEFLKEASDKKWVPDKCWTREWESDMEASFIANKSVMMLHGPWVWDKLLAANPSADQSGLPATPPAEGQETWMQYMSRTDVTARNGFCLVEGVQKKPEWEQVKAAYYWMFSPKAVKMYAEVAGRDVLYKLDEPLDIQGPQWVGVAKEIGTKGGLWEQAKYVDASKWGEVSAEAHRIGGSPGTWDYDGDGTGLANAVQALMTGAKSVQQTLDWAQANYDKSYKW
jgi:ABC-type glycerol-3-phosphate transport system substrate-binding protein